MSIEEDVDSGPNHAGNHEDVDDNIRLEITEVGTQPHKDNDAGDDENAL